MHLDCSKARLLLLGRGCSFVEERAREGKQQAGAAPVERRCWLITRYMARQNKYMVSISMEEGGEATRMT